MMFKLLSKIETYKEIRSNRTPLEDIKIGKEMVVEREWMTSEKDVLKELVAPAFLLRQLVYNPLFNIREFVSNAL